MIGVIKNKGLLIICFLGGIVFGYAQYDIPPVPTVQKAVYDYADVLSDGEERMLERKLLSYADSTSTQIVIIAIPELKGENIGILAPRWGHEWGIGQSDDDNGVIVLLSRDDREIWISPGYGAEIYLTAGIAGTIVRNEILPEFRKGDYYGGLDRGTTAIIEVLAGTFKGDGSPSRERGNQKGFSIIKAIVVIVFILIMLASRRGGGGRGGRRFRRSAAGDIIDILILTGAGRKFGSGSGGFGGGGFGGGFSGGFGGGGFSGGGAGGSW